MKVLNWFIPCVILLYNGIMAFYSPSITNSEIKIPSDTAVTGVSHGKTEQTRPLIYLIYHVVAYNKKKSRTEGKHNVTKKEQNEERGVRNKRFRRDLSNDYNPKYSYALNFKNQNLPNQYADYADDEMHFPNENEDVMDKKEDVQNNPLLTNAETGDSQKEYAEGQPTDSRNTLSYYSDPEYGYPNYNSQSRPSVASYPNAGIENAQQNFQMPYPDYDLHRTQLTQHNPYFENIPYDTQAKSLSHGSENYPFNTQHQSYNYAHPFPNKEINEGLEDESQNTNALSPQINENDGAHQPQYTTNMINRNILSHAPKYSNHNLQALNKGEDLSSNQFLPIYSNQESIPGPAILPPAADTFSVKAPSPAVFRPYPFSAQTYRKSFVYDAYAGDSRLKITFPDHKFMSNNELQYESKPSTFVQLPKIKAVTI